MLYTLIKCNSINSARLKTNRKIFLFVFNLAEFILLNFIMIPRLTIYTILLYILI